MTAAERMRAARERRRAGRLVVRVEVGHDIADALVDLGMLASWDSEDAGAIGRAIEALLRVTLGESQT